MSTHACQATRMLLILTITLFSACHPKGDPSPNLGCNVINLNSQMGGSPSQISPYKTSYFFDDFVRDPSVDSSCYTKKPSCRIRLEWFGTGWDCSDSDFNASDLADLNKCVWTVYNGYNFWGKEVANSRYSAKNIKVDGGNLILKTTKIKNTPSGKCGPGAISDTLSNEYNGLDCVYATGGIDSFKNSAAHIDGKETPALARVEFKAKFVSSPGSWAALWMWTAGGPGITQEIDIMEAPFQNGNKNVVYQTYHNWPGGSGSHSTDATPCLVDYTEWHTYGAEWTATEVRFYIDDEYKLVIKNNQASAHGNGILNVNAQNMAMILNLGFNDFQSRMIPTETFSERTMIVDWVKIFQ